MAIESNEGSVSELLSAWHWRAKRATLAHYETARRLSRRHYGIGVVLIVFSVVSTSLAGRSLFGLPNATVDGFMTAFSALTLVLACLHVFLQDAARTEHHRRAAIRYAASKRTIEQLLSKGSSVTAAAIASTNTVLNEIAEDAPPVPYNVWRGIEARAKPDKKSFVTPHSKSQ